jgi:methionyl-tRNA formyltransferase
MNLKIGYFADGPWSHQALRKILQDGTLEVAFVCARFDNPDPYLREESERLGIKFFVPENINSEDFLFFLKNTFCDLHVSMSFNQIFREKILSIPSKKTINCHAGKLPFYRGRNILNWALINDEKEFGVTVHYVDFGIDTGDIIVQNCYPISDLDTYATLLERSYSYCAETLISAIKLIQNGKEQPVSQATIDKVGFYCPQRKPGDEKIYWAQSSRDIFNFVRAICKPGPEARTNINGIEVRVNRIELIPGAPIYKSIPGAVLGKENENIIVKTGDSFVKIIEWASEGKIKIGDRFE